MAFDALTIKALVKELNLCLQNAKTDKIYQSEKDEIVINFRTYAGAQKLLISAGADYPRVQLTNLSKKNPDKPPMFCMLLRKHLSGAKLIRIEQKGFERVIDLLFEGYNELGDLSIKHLIIEIMGRYSNIIFTDDMGKILDAVKHVDIMTSSQRQVLGGLTYRLPPTQNKLDPIAATKEDFKNEVSDWDNSVRLDKYILGKILGVSPLIAREIAYKVNEYDIYGSSAGKYTQQAIVDTLFEFFADVKKEIFTPIIIKDVTDGKMIDFAPIAIKQYENAVQIENCEFLSQAAETFYHKKDVHIRMMQKSSELMRTINNHIERCQKKISLQEKTLEEAESKEKLRINADIVMANVYNIKRGQKQLVTQNFYDIDQNDIIIELDETLSPSENAQKYYKKYNKAKVAEIEQRKQIDIANDDLKYLEEALASAENADGEADLNEIKEQLVEQGYLSKSKSLLMKKAKSNKNQPKKIQLMHFVSSDGFSIFAGKNSGQNDYLTLRFANSQDLWFHTKNIPGSHTVIKLGLDKDVPDNTILEAAKIAAYYSKARNSSQIPVDYTIVKNVKKRNGAKPGMVIYDHYNTMYVKSDEELVDALQTKE